MNVDHKIWRDANGVCHVEAPDKIGVFGLMGYAHGKDRGMQILLMRILGQGRGSEILDSSDEMLAIDTFSHPGGSVYGNSVAPVAGFRKWGHP